MTAGDAAILFASAFTLWRYQKNRLPAPLDDFLRLRTEQGLRQTRASVCRHADGIHAKPPCGVPDAGGGMVFPCHFDLRRNAFSGSALRDQRSKAFSQMGLILGRFSWADVKQMNNAPRHDKTIADRDGAVCDRGEVRGCGLGETTQ